MGAITGWDAIEGGTDAEPARRYKASRHYVAGRMDGLLVALRGVRDKLTNATTDEARCEATAELTELVGRLRAVRSTLLETRD